MDQTVEKWGMGVNGKKVPWAKRCQTKKGRVRKRDAQFQPLRRTLKDKGYEGKELEENQGKHMYAIKDAQKGH